MALVEWLAGTIRSGTVVLGTDRVDRTFDRVHVQVDTLLATVEQFTDSATRLNLIAEWAETSEPPPGDAVWHHMTDGLWVGGATRQSKDDLLHVCASFPDNATHIRGRLVVTGLIWAGASRQFRNADT